MGESPLSGNYYWRPDSTPGGSMCEGKAGSYLAAFPDSPAFVAQRLLLTDVKIGKVFHVNEKAGR
jgi:hypothetical protein